MQATEHYLFYNISTPEVVGDLRHFNLLRLAVEGDESDQDELIKTLTENSNKVIQKCFYNAVKRREGNFSTVKAFVEHRANLNAIWDNARINFSKPLEVALCSGNERVIEYLIDAGAKINTINSHTRSYPLKVAINATASGKAKNDGCILKLLLKKGIYAHGMYSASLLEMFEWKSNPAAWKEVFNLFMKHGAELHSQPFLYYACKSVHLLGVKYIINSGLKPSQEMRHKGYSALHVARAYYHEEPFDDPIDTKRNAQDNCVEELLRWGADVDVQIPEAEVRFYDTFNIGISPLHAACAQVDLYKLAALLDYGANVHAVTFTNLSVLKQLLRSLFQDRIIMEHLYYSATGNRGSPDIHVEEADALNRLALYSTMARLLFAAGARLAAKECVTEYATPNLMLSPDILENPSPLLLLIRAFLDNVKDALSRRKTLKEMCRTVVRGNVSGKRSVQLLQLSPILPKPLVQYLTFGDICPEYYSNN